MCGNWFSGKVSNPFSLEHGKKKGRDKGNIRVTSEKLKEVVQGRHAGNKGEVKNIRGRAIKAMGDQMLVCNVALWIQAKRTETLEGKCQSNFGTMKN